MSALDLAGAGLQVIAAIDPLLFTVFAFVILALGLKALMLGAATAATRGRVKTIRQRGGRGVAEGRARQS